MCKRSKQAAALTVFGIVAAVIIGCETQQELERVLGKPIEAAFRVLHVIPGVASPGTTVRVETDRAVFGENSRAGVTIGGQAATIVRHYSDVAVEVLVPNVEPGVADVRVVGLDEGEGTPGELRVLPAPSLQLVLSLSGAGFELLEAKPGAAHPRRSTDPGGRRIQVEVFNTLGRLVFKDVLTHPTSGRYEIFDEPQSGDFVMHRLADRSTATMAIRIPNIPGGAEIRFYELPAGVVADSVEGLRARVLIDEMSL